MSLVPVVYLVERVAFAIIRNPLLRALYETEERHLSWSCF